MEHEKEIVLPPYLKEGDKVALVSPAYWIPQESIQEAAETVKSWGLQPVIGPHTNSLNVNVYAGTADERAADILWALKDSQMADRTWRHHHLDQCRDQCGSDEYSWSDGLPVGKRSGTRFSDYARRSVRNDSTIQDCRQRP